MKSFTKMFMMLLMLCAAGASYADENVIYVQDAEIPVEEVQVAQTIELSIWMKNTAPIRGFEFDMYLPEVISVKKNNKGRIQGVKFNAGRLPEDDEHTLTLSELSDGAVHFVIGSMYDETFTGNDGEIMIMEVNLSANVAVGNYPIQLKNIKLTETNPSNYYETELMESVFRVTGEPSLPNVVHDGTYYVMSAQEGTLINAENVLDAKGVPITFTFSNNAYTIEGADFFTGKQWTVAEAFEGMSGYYTISNTDGFVAVSATNTLEQIADGTADAAIWILLQKTYWEDIVNSTYTIAGTKNLTGTENDWDIVDANQMVYNEETGLYEKKFEGVVIENGNQPEFKVVQTNMEGNKIWYPNGDNWVITTSYVGGEGIYDITITFDSYDLKEIGVDAVKTGDITKNTYTATFKTNLVWESVYAYAWSGDGDTAVKFLGDWPGTKVTDVDDSNDDYDIYTLTFEAATAPEKIIFSNGVGGKVGRTQTADLEFVNGKEYSLIYVRSDLMEYAIQLADSADEGEALNKLLEAIQYAYENDDESQLQAAIDQFIADTEKANYFIEFTAGKYYIIDAETDMMMAAGGSFGTHGIVNERGLDLWLTPYTESRTVTIDSHVSGGGNSHFLSQNLFMDSEEWGWGLLYQGFGFYIKDPNSGKYINIDEDNNLVLSDTPREWIIFSAKGVMEERMGELAEATINNPKDATFLITAPNFNRNDQRNAEAWNVSGDCTLSTGNEVNNCAESLHSTFTISQTLAGAPKGTYQLTAQGFYRQDDGASEAAPQFFIGSEMVQLPKLTGSEANASDASASFTNGLYTIDPITFYYDGTGDLTIGIQGTAEHQWVVFDNFCLTYLSPEEIQGEDPADYQLYVAGVQVTSTNAKDILGDGGTFTFNAKTKTLTINGSYTYDNMFLIRNEVEDLTIYVANDVELSAAIPDFLFYLWKSTTITGPGKLTLNGNIAVIYGSLLTIKDANIEFPQTTSYAIMGNQEGEKLLINNSSIHAVSYYQAIGNFDGGITIENGMLEDGLRISDNGAYICKTDGGDANDVTIYNLEDYITGLKNLKDFKDSKDIIFNLAGQRLSKPAKGINIVGGKKMLIK